MGSQAGFLIKVLILSAGLSILIKYGGPTVPIPATPTNALMLVFVPTLIMALALLWRTWQQRQLT